MFYEGRPRNGNFLQYYGIPLYISPASCIHQYLQYLGKIREVFEKNIDNFLDVMSSVLVPTQQQTLLIQYEMHAGIENARVLSLN